MDSVSEEVFRWLCGIEGSEITVAMQALAHALHSSGRKNAADRAKGLAKAEMRMMLTQEVSV